MPIVPSNSTRQMPSFSYLQDRVNFVVLSTGDTIRIARVDNHIARVYFVDGNGNEVAIPAHYVMRDSDGVPVPHVAQNFLITWTTNYALYHLGAEPVFRLLQQKQQAIYAKGRQHWGVIEPAVQHPAHPPHDAGDGQFPPPDMNEEE